jgi:hypothetical protein
VVELLAPYAGRSVVNAGAVMWHGVTDDPLARAFALLGDAEAAQRHRAAALATYERVGATWWRDRLTRLRPDDGDERTHEPVVHLHEQAGGLWLVGREGATFVLPRMRGLEHLRVLVANPDTDVSARRLAGEPEATGQAGLEVLDDQARRRYRDRLAELEAGDDTDDPRLREERDWLTRELAAATGLAGRSRTTGSTDERARVAVRKAIVAALARIAEADPWVGRHLHDRVVTGLQCRYRSEETRPVTWRV